MNHDEHLRRLQYEEHMRRREAYEMAAAPIYAEMAKLRMIFQRPVLIVPADKVWPTELAACSIEFALPPDVELLYAEYERLLLQLQEMYLSPAAQEIPA